MKEQKQYNIFHYRWIIPIISVIYNQKGAKFVTLLNQLGISRSVLSSTLRKLIEQRFVIRNPGYGHPLRPEYLLTDKSIGLGPFCNDMIKCIGEQNGYHLFKSKWAIRIIILCIPGEVRFSELKLLLNPITSRALSEELKILSSEGYIKRKIIDDYPPLTTYSLTQKSIPFTKVINRHKVSLRPYL